MLCFCFKLLPNSYSRDQQSVLLCLCSKLLTCSSSRNLRVLCLLAVQGCNQIVPMGTQCYHIVPVGTQSYHNSSCRDPELPYSSSRYRATIQSLQEPRVTIQFQQVQSLPYSSCRNPECFVLFLFYLCCNLRTHKHEVGTRLKKNYCKCKIIKIWRPFL